MATKSIEVEIYGRKTATIKIGDSVRIYGSSLTSALYGNSFYEIKTISQEGTSIEVFVMGKLRACPTTFIAEIQSI